MAIFEHMWGSLRHSGARSISDLLTLMVASILLPLLIFYSAILWRVTQVEKERGEAEVQLASLGVAQDIDREVRAIKAALVGLATSPSLQNSDYVSFYSQATVVAQVLGSPIVLRDLATSQQIVNTRLPWGAPLPVDPPRDSTEKLLAGEETYTSDLFFAPVPQKNLIAIAVAVKKEQAPRFALLASIEPARLMAIMAEGQPKSSTFGLVDRKGRLVARTHQQEDYIGRTALGPGDVQIPKGARRIIDLDGVPVVQGFAHTQDGFVVTASVPQNAIDSPIRRSWLTFATVGAGLLALALPLTLYFARRITRSIKEVAEKAGALERGEVVPLGSFDVSEVAEVASVVHVASVTLRERTRLLAENAARFRTVFEQAAVGFQQTDLEGRWIMVNRKLADILGYSHSSLLALQPRDVCHPDDRDLDIAPTRQLLDGERDSFSLDQRWLKKTNEVVRMRITRSLVRDLDGVPLYFVAVVQDVTGDYNERAVTARLAALVEASHDAIISVSPEGFIETWNTGAEGLFQHAAGAVVGQHISMLASKNGQREINELIERGLTGQAERTETLLLRRDGQTIDVALGISPIRNEGRVTALSVTMEDIRERRLWENQLLLLNRELQHRVKNSMAVVQSIANQTLRATPDPASFHKAFLGRLQALAAANDLLLQTSWTGGDLETIIIRQLTPLLNDADSQLEVRGPRVALPAELTVPVALALHELGTNALKFGSLSRLCGRILITWIEMGEGSERRLVLTWKELGGPSPSQPTRTGFGSMLINRGVPGANVSQEFTGDGMVCTLDLPLPEIMSPEAAVAAHFALQRT